MVATGRMVAEDLAVRQPDVLGVGPVGDRHPGRHHLFRLERRHRASAASAAPKAIRACTPASPTPCTTPSTTAVQPAVIASGPTRTTRE